MDSLYAFKCKHFRTTRHSNIWNRIVKLFWNTLYIHIKQYNNGLMSF
jgi:hypothetical protein